MVSDIKYGLEYFITFKAGVGGEVMIGTRSMFLFIAFMGMQVLLISMAKTVITDVTIINC